MAEGTPHVADRSAEELRRDIETTREHIGDTVDAIEDRVRPGRIYERRMQRVRGTVERLRESVMGPSEDDGPGLLDRTGVTAGGAAHAVGHAPQAVRESARGNPLAAGLMAFGAGLVAASLLPKSNTEQRMAGQLSERLEPAKEQLGEAAREIGHEIGDTAREAVEHTKGAATEAARETRDDMRANRRGEHGR